MGLPQPRESSWFITGKDSDPVRHLFLLLEERMDGTGIWTLKLRLCLARREDASTAEQQYDTEAQARTALQAIYTLSRYLCPLPTWDPETFEVGRWRIRTQKPTEYDLHHRSRHTSTPRQPMS